MAGYSGDAGDAMGTAEDPLKISNGRMFSTLDSDNDARDIGGCAVRYGSGWWFGKCSMSDLNRYESIWTTAGSTVWAVQASHMMVKCH